MLNGISSNDIRLDITTSTSTGYSTTTTSGVGTTSSSSCSTSRRLRCRSSGAASVTDCKKDAEKTVSSQGKLSSTADKVVSNGYKSSNGVGLREDCSRRDGNADKLYSKRSERIGCKDNHVPASCRDNNNATTTITTSEPQAHLSPINDPVEGGCRNSKTQSRESGADSCEYDVIESTECRGQEVCGYNGCGYLTTCSGAAGTGDATSTACPLHQHHHHGHSDLNNSPASSSAVNSQLHRRRSSLASLCNNNRCKEDHSIFSQLLSLGFLRPSLDKPALR